MSNVCVFLFFLAHIFSNIFIQVYAYKEPGHLMKMSKLKVRCVNAILKISLLSQIMSSSTSPVIMGRA